MGQRFRGQNIWMLPLLILLLLVILSPILLNGYSRLLGWWTYRGVELPEDFEIESMTASISMHISSIPEFPVPTQDIPKIMKQLRPAEKDYDPLAWFGLGELKLKCKGGRDLRIWLFYFCDDKENSSREYYKEGKGAFSIAGPHGDVYFRGGKSADLKAAIEEAYADFKSMKAKN
jgi:hypothetical protein